LVGIALRDHLGGDVADYYISFHSDLEESITTTKDRQTDDLGSNHLSGRSEDMEGSDSAWDPVGKLRELKQMLDEGLISQEDYQKNKKIILDQM
jgi:hypothetical protein